MLLWKLNVSMRYLPSFWLRHSTMISFPPYSKLHRSTATDGGICLCNNSETLMPMVIFQSLSSYGAAKRRPIVLSLPRAYERNRDEEYEELDSGFENRCILPALRHLGQIIFTTVLDPVLNHMHYKRFYHAYMLIQRPILLSNGLISAHRVASYSWYQHASLEWPCTINGPFGLILSGIFCYLI
jgi:hypothetical protein